MAFSSPITITTTLVLLSLLIYTTLLISHSEAQLLLQTENALHYHELASTMSPYSTTSAEFISTQQPEEDDDEEEEDDDTILMTSSSGRSLLWQRIHHRRSRYYISYGVLMANKVPCPPRSGRSYYTHNCYKHKHPANPYTRGCSAITRCRR